MRNLIESSGDDNFITQRFNQVLLHLAPRWDTAGQERFKCIASSYYRGAHGNQQYFFKNQSPLFFFFSLFPIESIQTFQNSFWIDNTRPAMTVKEANEFSDGVNQSTSVFLFSLKSAVIVVFDVTDLYSLSSVPKWLEDALKANVTRPLVFLVGAKRDLLVKRTILLFSFLSLFLFLSLSLSLPPPLHLFRCLRSVLTSSSH